MTPFPLHEAAQSCARLFQWPQECSCRKLAQESNPASEYRWGVSAACPLTGNFCSISFENTRLLIAQRIVILCCPLYRVFTGHRARQLRWQGQELSAAEMGQKLQLLRVRMHVSVLGSLLKASDYFSHASLPQEAQCRELSRSLEDAACCRPATFAIPSIVQGCFMHLSIHSLCADDIKKQKQEEHAAGKPTLDSPSPNGQLLSVSDYLHCDGKLR